MGPDPNDVVKETPSMSDTLSGGAIEAPSPAAGGAIENPALRSDAPPQPQGDTTNNAAAPANNIVAGDTPKKAPSKWEAILTGALVGLSGGAGAKSFGEGLSGGASAFLKNQQLQKENAMRQEELQGQREERASRIKFQNAQAAAMAAEAAMRDKQIHQMDQDFQDRHNAATLEQMKTMQDMGLTPTLVVANNTGGKEATAGLQQLTDSHGGVPPLFTLNMGNKIVAYDLNQLSQAPQGLDQVNKIRTLTGQAAITPGQWAQTPQTAKVEQTKFAFDFFNPAPSEDNLMRYQNYLKTAQASPDSPEKAQNVQKLQGIVTTMKSGLDSQNARETKMKANQAATVASASATASARAQLKVADEFNSAATEADPSSNSILKATGLSAGAFAFLTGNAGQLPRDKFTRAKAMKEAQDWAAKNNVDPSMIAAKYKAAAQTLQVNIERLNNTENFERELLGPELVAQSHSDAVAGRKSIQDGNFGSGTIANLKDVVDVKKMGKVNFENVLKVWWGQQTNDKDAQQYAMHLSQLRSELVGYFAATNGRTGGNITESDKREADMVLRNGMSTGSLQGLALSVYNSTAKMRPAMEASARSSEDQIWAAFGAKKPAPGQAPQGNGGGGKQSGWGGKFGGVKH